MNWLVFISRTNGTEEPHRCDDYEFTEGVLFLRNGEGDDVKYDAFPLDGTIRQISIGRLQ